VNNIEKNMKLRVLIVEKFGTQEKFAATIGIREDIVSKLVRGIRPPTETEKSIISAALETSPEELFD
jgi:DNA-binding transcriptional regulator YdaS (Cro superfamily)